MHFQSHSNIEQREKGGAKYPKMAKPHHTKLRHQEAKSSQEEPIRIITRLVRPTILFGNTTLARSWTIRDIETLVQVESTAVRSTQPITSL